MRFKFKREKPKMGNEIVLEERECRGSDWDDREKIK
jgi:hypothetical protein